MRKLRSILIAVLFLSGATAYGQTISGHLRVCLGGSRTTLSVDTSGGTWSSGDVTKATVDASTGVVAGVASGTALISYNLPSLTVTATVTVSFINLNMGLQVGISPTCIGSFTTYTASPTSGTGWTSSNLAVGTINTGGNLDALSSGTTVISYRHAAADCYITTSQTVNPLPTVNVFTPVCAATTYTMTAAPLGGTWASSNLTVGTINSSTGAFIGFTSGTTFISYTLSTGCRATAAVSVTPTPTAITGVLTMCQGSTTTLTSEASQTWSSSNPAVATVASVTATTGLVTGVAAGTAAISYTNAAGCSRIVTVTVTSPISPNTGAALVCMGNTTTLSNATGGGAWSSGNIPVANVNSISGLVTPASVGLANITYTTSSPACNAITQVTVNAALPAITPASPSICVGANTTLSNATGGGTWTSSNGNATIDISTGIVTGVTNGTAIITYAFGAGCFITKTITVNPVPVAIGGTFDLCVGSTTTLTNGSGGGTWVSDNAAVGTINSTTGVLGGISSGNAIISYRFAATGCQSTQQVTVNPLPSAISGTLILCETATTALSSSPGGGAWSSSNTLIATVGTDGTVTGVLAGNANISYVLPTGCRRVVTVTVNTLPVAITGAPFAVCQGSTKTLINTTPGGTWVSGNTAIGTVGSATGVVGGIAVSGGVVTISYTMGGSGCLVTQDVTVNALPAGITGTLSLCGGNTTLLASTTPGGTWSSSNLPVATVGTNGLVTGVTAGNSTISYTLPTGCFTIAEVTVNPVPPAIGGAPFEVCEGSSITLTDAAPSGTWISSNTAIATVGSASGIVTGVAVSGGVATISYVLIATGCQAAQDVTVNARPAVISGTLVVCEGFTTNLSSSPGGGTWESGNTGIASVGTSGIVTGVSSGNTNISYTLATGCRRIANVTVDVSPTTITGNLNVCYGQTNTLASTPAGQTWSSGTTSVATVNPTTGDVFGVAVGVANITYTNGNGCFTSTQVTVSTGPNTGDPIVCVGQTVTLSNGTAGGTWSSSNTSIATVDISTGIVTGVAAGPVNITYTVAAFGCTAVTAMTVNAALTSITGQFNICIGSSTTLAHGIGGGTWSSSNTAIATAGTSTGIITGVSGGVATITYTISSGCIMTAEVTVYVTLPSITGANNICIGDAPTTYTHAISGGTWSSSSPSTATVGSLSGDVTALSPGTSTITYSLSSGCFGTKVISVYQLPFPITGDSTVCSGTSIGLLSYPETGPGGVWTSSNTGVATIGTASGVITGVSIGTTVVSYTKDYFCYVTRVQTVNISTTPITGLSTMCSEDTLTFTSSPSGGSWSTTNSAVATVNSSTGLVTGIIGGTATIRYALATGCESALVVTVLNSPDPITGDLTICIGNSASLYSTTSGGTWSSGDISKVTVSVSGVITGIATGTATISYTHPTTSCVRTVVVTVNSVVAASTGDSVICHGNTTTFTNATGGGNWSSSNISVAHVNSSTGVVTGISPGVCNINYVLSSSCYYAKALTVNGTPAAITGVTNLCIGTTTTLGHPVSGGTWVSSNTAGATVGSSSGIVTGVSVGTTVISYFTTPYCFRTVTVSVYNSPGTITGTTTVCVGSATILSNSLTGGSWSSSNTSVADVYISSGSVTGVNAGVATITYTMSSGCFTTTDVTVIAAPAAIVGTTPICASLTTTYTNSVLGGTWSSANTAVATINASTGDLTAVTGGVSIITYTLSTGCQSIKSMTVNNAPAAITGTFTICAGTTTLSSTTTGATWTSTNTGVATIGSSTGVVTPAGTGTSTISYTNSNGCATTAVVSVNAVPSANTGAALLCLGSASTLSNATSGGTWSTSNASVATVHYLTGIVTSTGIGNANISYTLAGTGCFAVTAVTVNAALATITGSTNICVDGTSTLNHTTGGGTWSSSNGAVASIGSSTGLVTGISAGTITMTYTVSTGCYTTITFVVNALPGTIDGTASVCPGTTTALTNSTSGGAWSSTSTANATIHITSGVVTGVAAGITTISYVVSPGCFVTRDVTVNSLPAAITGTAEVCVSSTTSLSSATSGGTWTSGNTSVATVGGTTGIVSGVSAGTSIITYTIGTGCYTTITVSVGTTPAVITGTLTICTGSTTTLSTVTSGGTWSSSNTAVATTGSSAPTATVVTGIATGIATISYTKTGCTRTADVTVNAGPGVITGDSVVCIGNTMTLSNATSGGTWSTSNATIATIGGTTGVVSGVGAGTATITYTSSPSCYVTKQITVNSTLAAIGGSSSVCLGYTTVLTHAAGGGTWSSSNPAIGSVSTSGVVTGLSTGSFVISYSIGGGCFTARSMVVYSLPAAITGASSVCVGSAIMLSNTGSGGTWSSSSAGTATVGSASGIVTGVSSGNATITYTATTGCFAVTTISVNALPSAIFAGGSSLLCVGTSITLTDTTAGGTWASSNTATATVGSATGIVNGIATGMATISYISASGCPATYIVTVNAIPAAISGSLVMCNGGTTTLSSTTSGATWSSSNTSVATVGSASATTGLVTSTGIGTTIISYTNSTGCPATVVVTVSAPPGANTGSTLVCIGSTTTLANATGGGTWASSVTAKATVGATTGIVTGVSVGTSNITYTISGAGCISVTQVTVDAAPASITGTTTVCVGSSSTLSHAVTGGTWTSSNTAIATVGSVSGTVTGVSTGAAVITYYVTSSCYKTISVTVQAGPSAISGSLIVCPGSTTSLSNATSGGTWSSSNTGVALPHTVTGLVYGISTGTATISYILSSGCFATAEVSVNSLPGGITGTAVVCVAGTTTLSATPGGGTWSSSNTAKATVGSTSGIVTGVAGGTARITYSLGAGCVTSIIVTVGTMPPALTGTLTTCVGSTTTLNSTTAGGTWTSGNTAIATTGTIAYYYTPVTGTGVGVTSISYLVSGCVREASVTVNAAPGVITGDSIVCIGNSLTLSNTAGGGTWSSSNTSKANVGATTGIVNGVGAGTAIISYKTSATCYVVKQITVTGTPAAITGSTVVCLGYTTTLSHAVSGGTWSSSNTAKATVDASGVVTGVSTGSFVITYDIGGGCYTVKSMIVYGVPSAITGTASVCAGSYTVLSSGTGGGTWSSSNTAVGTVHVSSGAVTGLSTGTTTITYQATTGCFTLREVTVNAAPGAISGATPICAGTTVEFTDTTYGGTWSSSNTSVATIGTSTGIIPTTSGYVTAITGGVTTISYTLPTGCRSTFTLTVNNAPTAITGSLTICVGGTATLSSSPSGGTWSVVGTSVASIGASTGLLTAIAAGSTTVSYMHPTSGCVTTAYVTINSALPANTGSPIVCVGQTTTLSNSAGGGTWTSSTISKATVSASTGVVTGVATGTSNISYVTGAGCFAVTMVTVNATPASITGTATACVGQTSTLSHTVGGGSWVSSNTALATVDISMGVVTGISSGSATISYLISPGCYSATAFIVKALPAAIGGSPMICPGTYTTLTNGTSGGTWSSSNTSVATIGSTSGIAAGITIGTTTVTYKVTSTQCYITQGVTVYPIPEAPVVTPSSAIICSGSSALLTVGSDSASASVSSGSISVSFPDNDATGAYTSLAMSSVPSGATVTGVSVTINMTHTWMGDMIVNLTAPNGSTLNLFNRHGGSGDNLTNTVVSSAGTTAFTSGSAPFTGMFAATAASGVGPTSFTSDVTSFPSLYSVPNGTWTLSGRDAAGADLGTFTSWNVTINYTVPSTITWSAATGLFTDAGLSTAYTTGADADSVYAYFTATGTSPVTHVHSVTSTISGCSSSPSTVSVTYYPVLPTISGPSTVCGGSEITLTNSLTGGTWTSGNTDVATVNSTSGVVTGVAAGTAMITYFATSGCYTTTVISVSIPDATISGGSAVCVGSTLELSAATSGGSWSTDSSGVATVDGSGIVTGITAGSVGITYSVTNTCGTATSTAYIMVDAPVSVGEITAFDTICKFMGGMCGTSATGGYWTTSNSSVLTITEGGFMSGVGFGTEFVYYIVSNSCGSDTGAHTVTVRDGELPNGGRTIGAETVCTGASVTLQHITTHLSISNPSEISGEIVFAESDHWGGTHLPIMNQPAKMGPDGDTTGCGGFDSGYFAGKVAVIWRGTCEFSLKALNAQNAGAIACVIVNNNPDYPFHMGIGAYGDLVTIPVYMIRQADGALISEKLHLSEDVRMSVSLDTSSDGSWESSAPSIASVVSTGEVTGVSSGSATISYYTYSGCGYNYALHEMSVNPTPEAGTITGGTTTTVGGSLTLADSVTGGTWSSSNTSVATVGTTGIVTGVSAGTVVISYTVVSGECEATATLGIEVTDTTTVTPCTPVYGDPHGSCVSYEIIIKDFTLGGSSETSISDIGTGCDGSGYQNRVGIASVPTLEAGGSYTAGVLTGSANYSYVQAWIDYNNDGEFESGETVGGTTTYFVGSTTFGVSVSGSAPLGSHLMRVRLVWYGDGIPYPSIPACGGMSYGEAHDYQVNIVIPAPKPGTGSADGIASFSVAPNPTSGRLTIQSSVSGALAIYTIDGRELQQYQVSTGSTVISMPNNLASGVYMLRFKGDDGSTQTARLVYQP